MTVTTVPFGSVRWAQPWVVPPSYQVAVPDWALRRRRRWGRAGAAAWSAARRRAGARRWSAARSSAARWSSSRPRRSRASWPAPRARPPWWWTVERHGRGGRGVAVAARRRGPADDDARLGLAGRASLGDERSQTQPRQEDDEEQPACGAPRRGAGRAWRADATQGRNQSATRVMRPQHWVTKRRVSGRAGRPPRPPSRWSRPPSSTATSFAAATAAPTSGSERRPVGLAPVRHRRQVGAVGLDQQAVERAQRGRGLPQVGGRLEGDDAAEGQVPAEVEAAPRLVRRRR